jgi:hypothetical protein
MGGECIVDAKLRGENVMDAIVVMLPEAEGVQRWQECKRACNPVQQTAVAETLMPRVVTDNCRQRDHCPGADCEQEFQPDVAGQYCSCHHHYVKQQVKGKKCQREGRRSLRETDQGRPHEAQPRCPG